MTTNVATSLHIIINENPLKTNKKNLQSKLYDAKLDDSI